MYVHVGTLDLTAQWATNPPSPQQQQTYHGGATGLETLSLVNYELLLGNYNINLLLPTGVVVADSLPAPIMKSKKRRRSTPRSVYMYTNHKLFAN